MPRRSVLTERRRSKLLGLPTDEASMLRHYILSDFDLEQIRQRRRAQNKISFALQLCALRYPGRLLSPDETIPLELLKFLGDQLSINASDLAGYAVREETRREHLIALRKLYGFKTYSGRGAKSVKDWLIQQAIERRSILPNDPTR